MGFGENVRTLRIKAGYTQAQLACELGISQAIVAQYETGAKAPNVFLAARIAEKLGTTCDGLLHGKEETS